MSTSPVITQCPACGYRTDTFFDTGLQQIAPQDGDLSICVDCLAPAVFAVTAFGIGLRACEPDEAAQFAADHREHADLLRYIKTHDLGPADPEHPSAPAD